MIIRKEDALEYHSTPPPGKLGVVATKPCRTQRDLSLAYTPGGAVPCLEIQRDPRLLSKPFADVAALDIDLDTHDPKEVIRTCQLLEPTFGGINLEDIKAPECFEIEDELKRTMKIPVFHDDQHGTALISGAALLNALEVEIGR